MSTFLPPARQELELHGLQRQNLIKFAWVDSLYRCSQISGPFR